MLIFFSCSNEKDDSLIIDEIPDNPLLVLSINNVSDLYDFYDMNNAELAAGVRGQEDDTGDYCIFKAGPKAVAVDLGCSFYTSGFGSGTDITAWTQTFKYYVIIFISL